MSDLRRFLLPDVGEGLTEAEIVTWKVAPGDTVAVNDEIVEIETAKSLVELPSPYAGVVAELLVAEGSTVAVGTPIIAIDVGMAGRAVPATDLVPPESAAGEATTDRASSDEGPSATTPVLVGYGPRATGAGRRPRRPAAGPTGPAAVPVPAPAGGPRSAPAGRPHAKPPVRKLAKDLGIDIATVTPSGPGGTVTREDVRLAADTLLGGAVTATAAASAVSGVAGERRIPIRGVRKAIAQAVSASAFTAPHVTEFVTVDVTRTMRLVSKLRSLPDFAEAKVTPLLLVARALLIAIGRHPEVNATWDDAAQMILMKKDVNLGIAAATPRGLIVPNIKGADSLSLPRLAAAMTKLVTVAREGRTTPADMSGGTVTITNIGVFGVDTGTPILNPGEAAILGFGAVREQPWVHKGRVRVRLVTTLALSFDHRLVDGELGSRVLADVAAVLKDPELAVAWA